MRRFKSDAGLDVTTHGAKEIAAQRFNVPDHRAWAAVSTMIALSFRRAVCPAAINWTV
jgi:hypothetical protein